MVSMEDRELLELAAKAAGYRPWGSDCEGYPIFVVDSIPIGWNPLADDADALRLTVELSLHVRVCRRMVLVEQREIGDDKTERLHPDPYAATRRAIVRAAAEIGKAIQVKP